MKTTRILATLALLACLVTTSVTYAWVSINKGVMASNMRMTIQPVSDVTTLSCYALRFDGSLGAICYKIGEGQDEVLDVTMTEFDRIFRDRIVNTPLIYVLELGNVPNTAGSYISIKVPCTGKYIQPATGAATNSYVDNGNSSYVINEYISNVISVKIGCSGSITEPTATTTQRVENNVNIFKTQIANFRSITSGDRMAEFVSVTRSNDTVTYSKVQNVQIRLTQSEYSGFLYNAPDEGGGSSNHLMLYIQFDYDESLMDTYITRMTDDSKTDIAFVDDLGVIQMLVGAGGY